MNSKILIFVFLLSFILTGCVYDNNYFIEFNQESDLNILVEKMSNADIVLLGESTHGTQEFYEIRNQISKRLIEDHDFDFIVVEGDWNSLYQLNLYVKGFIEKDSSKEILKNFHRWPTWMWANDEIYHLTEWLREYNENLPLEDKIGFYGFDVYDTETALRVVQDSTDEKYDCLSMFINDFNNYANYLYQGNYPCNVEAERIYNNIKNNEYYKENLIEKDYFYLKQNAFVVKNAEKFQRGRVFQDINSWNKRVIHMNNTLEKLMQSKGKKAIVWAHNTHVGDASHTRMKDQGNVNIGQLLREAGQNVFILGFGTYTGHVLAGSSWGNIGEIMKIPEANPDSYEYLLKKLGLTNSIIFLGHEKLPEELRQINNNRAIGVVYNPQNEYPGNYVRTDLKNRYDAFIFIKETNSLKPLKN